MGYNTKRRQEIKQKIINALGKKCQICGYKKYQGALEFHHLDDGEKDFTLGGALHNKSLKSIVEEVKKCILLCSNCHREFHGGLWNLPENITTLPDDFKILTKYEKARRRRLTNQVCSCGNKKHERAKNCKKCDSKLRRKIINRPNKEVLQDLIKNNTWVAIGKIYSVSDNTIRKWAREYGIL